MDEVDLEISGNDLNFDRRITAFRASYWVLKHIQKRKKLYNIDIYVETVAKNHGFFVQIYLVLQKKIEYDRMVDRKIVC